MKPSPAREDWMPKKKPVSSETLLSEPELPPFPEIAWRGIFDSYRRAMAGTTEASDVAHFAALWATLAAILGRRILMYSGDRVYPNVYLAFAGATGDKKTTAMRRIFSCDLLANRKVKTVQNVGSTEGLADHLQLSADGAYLFFWEEFASFLNQARWKGSTLLEFFTETFDCPAAWERPYRKTPISLIKPTPTVLTGTTSEWFWKYAKAEDFFGGFGNRVFFLSGDKKAPIPNPSEPDAQLLGLVHEQINRLDQIVFQRMEWETRAEREWNKFYIDFEGKARHGLLGAAIKRIHVYVRKLAMLYSILEGDREIGVESLRAAIAVGLYAVECTDRLINLQAVQSTPDAELETRLVKWVAKHEGCRIRQMQQANQRYCGTAKKFNELRDNLVKSDQIDVRDHNRVYLSVT